MQYVRGDQRKPLQWYRDSVHRFQNNYREDTTSNRSIPHQERRSRLFR